jgi:hypothetical protein
MKALKLLVFSFLISLSSIAFAQYDNINFALKTGNTSELLKNCSSNIELIFDNKEGVYSKTQASMILKDFFKTNKPSSFKITHEGGKEGAKYLIGQLVTGNGEFRVHYFIKKENNKPFVYQLRITQQKY